MIESIDIVEQDNNPAMINVFIDGVVIGWAEFHTCTCNVYYKERRVSMDGRGSMVIYTGDFDIYSSIDQTHQLIEDLRDAKYIAEKIQHKYVMWQQEQAL